MGCNSSHIPRTSGRSIRTGLQALFQILFHLLKSPLHRAPHGTLMDTLSPCYFGIALAEDHTGVHPSALRFRQRIERNTQMAEQLHAFQQFLRGRFRNAYRVFDPVLTIERVLRFVADDPPLIGGLVQSACPELVSHFLGNLYVFVAGVPRIKVFQIDRYSALHPNVVF